VGYGLSVALQNQREDKDSAGHASRSSSLLHLKASWARISQSSLKTSGGAAQIVHVASLRNSHGDDVEDEWMDQCNGLHQTLLP
jgi:hypothetical protein